MPQDSNAPSNHAPEKATDSEVYDGLKEIFDLVAAGLYSMASMLVGEGEQSVQLVESALADAEVSVCCDPIEARRSSRLALAKAAVRTLAERDPASLIAPYGLSMAESCIGEDDLEIARQVGEDMERMISGPDRDRARQWLAGLSTRLRIVFVLRAVAGLTVEEITQLLAEKGDTKVSRWTPNAVSEVFRQGLCSLTSQRIQANATR